MQQPSSGSAMTVAGDEWTSLVESSLKLENSSNQNSNTIVTTTTSSGKKQNHRGVGAPAVISATSAVAATDEIDGIHGKDTSLHYHHNNNNSHQLNNDSQFLSHQHYPQESNKIDVLRELEDIANMTIAETGFFCK